MSRNADVQLRMKRQAADVPPSAVDQVSLEVVNVGPDPELRMVDEFGVAWPVGSGGGTGNLDGGGPSSTYGGTSPVDGGTP
jgi:hypothetical protein